MDKITAHNKNYMPIGASVRTTKFAARNNSIGVGQESNPQSQQYIVPSDSCQAMSTLQTPNRQTK